MMRTWWIIMAMVLALTARRLVDIPLPTVAATDAPQHVILFVGDGMGSEQVRAARYFVGAPLPFERLPYTSTLTTDSVDGVTDSAASATAMATARKVFNGVVSVALPGDGQALRTALEHCQGNGQATGLVTTSYMTDATPAAFAAHEPSRGNRTGIALDYLSQTRPNVLLGGGGNGLATTQAAGAGYTVVTDTASLQAVAPGTSHVAGLFGTGELPSIYDGRGQLPTLAQMTASALTLLQDDPDGFFLLVEQEHVDSFGHQNDITRTVYAMVELADAVDVALNWAAGHDDTLLLVTSDHETGGLDVLADNGPGNLPLVAWSTRRHTNRRVPLFGVGSVAGLVQAVDDNTDLTGLLTTCDGVPTALTAHLDPVTTASGAAGVWPVLLVGLALFTLWRYRR